MLLHVYADVVVMFFCSVAAQQHPNAKNVKVLFCDLCCKTQPKNGFKHFLRGVFT